MNVYSASINLTPQDNNRLLNLCGEYDKHIRQIEKHLDIAIRHRGYEFIFTGIEGAVQKAVQILTELYAETATGKILSPNDVHLFLQHHRASLMDTSSDKQPVEYALQTKTGAVKPHTSNQARYLQNISTYDINFGIGPAGTGKTYLAVACAIDALEKEKVRRVILARPAVEAGERLGFLPGDLAEKVEPYLRPLYDALFEMMGFERVGKLIEQRVIEIAPLAFMRGRTLNESFIILDESQNTTTEQMKMFLTRIGFGSKVIITGDITQIDLPRGKKSGLIEAMNILSAVDGISFTYFDSKDVVRHTLVQRIIEAYASYEKAGSSKD